MNITFHECRYILHLKDYDSGVFFYREVLGLQPNYNWSIVPDQKGYRFYMGSGRLEITQIPFTPRQGHSEFLAQCSDLPLCMERILDEMPHIEIRPAGCTLGPSMVGLEASSVNKLYDRFSQSPDYKEAGVLRDTDFDARRLFQMYDPSGNVVEIYAYLRNVREEILMH